MSRACAFCEATDDLEEHHVVPRRLGGTDDDQNLITVCSNCHKTIERTWDAGFYHAIGVRDGMTPGVMFDTIKDLHDSLLKAHSATTGAYTWYKQRAKYASRDPIAEDRYLTEWDVMKARKDGLLELLEGDVMPGLYAVEKLDELSDQTYSLRDALTEADDGYE